MVQTWCSYCCTRVVLRAVTFSICAESTENMKMWQTWGLGAAALLPAFCCDLGSFSVSLSWTSCNTMQTHTPVIVHVKCSAGHNLPKCRAV